MKLSYSKTSIISIETKIPNTAIIHLPIPIYYIIVQHYRYKYHYNFFGLNSTPKNPLNRPTTVKVPPTKAHIDVKNSYQRLERRATDTAIGDRS